jgi:hypothetical protein
LGFFQILENDAMTEIRVLTGRLGFKREFKSREDPLYGKSWISAEETAS